MRYALFYACKTAGTRTRLQKQMYPKVFFKVISVDCLRKLRNVIRRIAGCEEQIIDFISYITPARLDAVLLTKT